MLKVSSFADPQAELVLAVQDDMESPTTTRAR
jgi:hypothetical protein